MGKNVRYGKRRKRELEAKVPKDPKEVTPEYKGPIPRPVCNCEGWGCFGCSNTEQEIRSRQGTFG